MSFLGIWTFGRRPEIFGNSVPDTLQKTPFLLRKIGFGMPILAKIFSPAASRFMKHLPNTNRPLAPNLVSEKLRTTGFSFWDYMKLVVLNSQGPAAT